MCENAQIVRNAPTPSDRTGVRSAAATSTPSARGRVEGAEGTTKVLGGDGAAVVAGVVTGVITIVVGVVGRAVEAVGTVGAAGAAGAVDTAATFGAVFGTEPAARGTLAFIGAFIGALVGAGAVGPLVAGAGAGIVAGADDDGIDATVDVANVGAAAPGSVSAIDGLALAPCVRGGSAAVGTDDGAVRSTDPIEPAVGATTTGSGDVALSIVVAPPVVATSDGDTTSPVSVAGTVSENGVATEVSPGASVECRAGPGSAKNASGATRNAAAICQRCPLVTRPSARARRLARATKGREAAIMTPNRRSGR